MSREHRFLVKGMHCPACEFLVADEVAGDPEVASARASLAEGRLWVTLAEDGPDPLALKTRWYPRLDALGYRLFLEGEDPVRETRRETVLGFGLGIGFLGLFAVLQVSGLVDLLSPESLGPGGAFILGVLASVSSCFALVGGLLISYTAAVGRRNPGALGPGLAAFHGSRLAVFAIGGGILGLAGSALESSLDVQKILLTLAALVMAGLGANLLGFRLPGAKPRVKVGKLRRFASWGTIGGGALLGLATFFLPCGFTQSVQFQALAAGGFIEGAVLTLAFALGTLPILGSVGWLMGRGLTGAQRAILLKAGGTLVLGLGLFQLWGSLHLWGLRLPPLFS